MLVGLSVFIALVCTQLASAAGRIPAATAYYVLSDAVPDGTISPAVADINFGVIDQLMLSEVAPFVEGGMTVPNATATILVQAAHLQGKLAGIVVGGFDATMVMSSWMATAQGRSTLVGNLTAITSQYGFDSLEIDWVPAALSNATDVTALGELFQAIRSAQPNLRLGMSLSSLQQQDFSSLARYLDWGNLQAYNLFDPYNATTTQAVSPTITCSQELTGDPSGGNSVSDLISQWLAAGWPADQLVLSFAPTAYEYSDVSTSVNSSTSLFQPTSSNMSYTTSSTAQLISQDVLSSDAQTAEGSYQRYWSTCTLTPYLISQANHSLIAYEDPQSVSAKAQLARGNGLAGIAEYGIAGDGPHQVLLQAAKTTFQGSSGWGGKWIALWVWLGLIVLALGALTICCCWIRRRRQRATARKQVRTQMASINRTFSTLASLDDKQPLVCAQWLQA